MGYISDKFTIQFEKSKTENSNAIPVSEYLITATMKRTSVH